MYKTLIKMLLIHWSKHNNTDDILKNGIRPKTRKIEDTTRIKGVWCYPFSRNKMFNNNWKRNLKQWRGDNGNFNGFVFKLEKSDFPIYAGEFALVGSFPDKSIYESYDHFSEIYGTFFKPNKMEEQYSIITNEYLDYQDFEIVLMTQIDPSRIIKVIKDRIPLKK